MVQYLNHSLTFHLQLLIRTESEKQSISGLAFSRKDTPELTFWPFSSNFELVPFWVPAMEGLRTRTLAEIYLKQGHLQEAYEIFQALMEKDPSDREISTKVEELKGKVERVQTLQKWLANIRNRRKR